MVRWKRGKGEGKGEGKERRTCAEEGIQCPQEARHAYMAFVKTLIRFGVGAICLIALTEHLRSVCAAVSEKWFFNLI